MNPSQVGGAVRWLLLFVSLIFSGALILEAGRTWMAAFFSQSSDPADWERAAALEPGNADYWQRLGRYRQWDFQNADLRRAVADYERATQINPRSAYLWMDLASAYEMAGDLRRAREAFEKAKANYPISSEVAWNYGNFLLRSGEFPKAFAEIRRAISADPSLAALAVSVCWRAGADVERIFAEVVPPHPAAYLDAVDFFLGQQEIDSALRIWSRIPGLHEPIDLKRSFGLIEELARRGRVVEARDVWRQALAAARREPPASIRDSLVWDGGFEGDFLNGAFGWRQVTSAEASVDFDSSAPHSGSRSLQITFDGSANVDFEHVVQRLVVEPGTRYRFQAYLKLDGVSTDSGIRFRIFDYPRVSDIDLLTPSLTGTLPWTMQELEFTTGRDTRLLAIALRRQRSLKLDNKIRGTVWVDDVSLVPVPAAPQAKR